MEGKRYKTERGVSIGIVPIPLLLDKIRESHPPTPRPTYVEHLAGGATQPVEISDAMAAIWERDNPESWQEHAAAWAHYQAQADERTKRLNDALWKAVMRRAIVVDMPDDGWVYEQRELGIDVPDDPKERRDHYIWTEVMGGQHDILRVMSMAAGADLTEEQLSAAEASFWDTLQRPAAGLPAGQARPVAAGDAGGDDTGGQSLGQEA